MYYSGHRLVRCIHTQVVIDDKLLIRHVEIGFSGHTNDVQAFGRRLTKRSANYSAKLCFTWLIETSPYNANHYSLKSVYVRLSKGEKASGLCRAFVRSL